MAMVVLMSTMSFAINKHYCMDMLVDVSVVLPASTCGMELYATDLDQDLQITNSACCQDEHIAIQGQDEVKPSTQWSPEDLKMVVTAFAYSYQMLFTEDTPRECLFPDYSPPLITKDFPVIYETYLI